MVPREGRRHLREEEGEEWSEEEGRTSPLRDYQFLSKFHAPGPNVTNQTAEAATEEKQEVTLTHRSPLIINFGEEEQD